CGRIYSGSSYYTVGYW
nr:immunoglobulin heavy chain junction region [Macaca mulatta]MOV39573.1 immunoglobulin heavy chain junction region [Macaca mulatta]MOV41758.1 immunoglobulin heavy chain junction region [Macaca mulatta]MOV42738.1 immunoglobulin heavy chain junction region [Macaca mulatta]MOV43837.1 immunoglobulin heavy chain junction region [Macaca mulatta]